VKNYGDNIGKSTVECLQDCNDCISEKSYYSQKYCEYAVGYVNAQFQIAVAVRYVTELVRKYAFKIFGMSPEDALSNYYCAMSQSVGVDVLGRRVI